MIRDLQFVIAINILKNAKYQLLKMRKRKMIEKYNIHIYIYINYYVFISIKKFIFKL